MLKAVRFDENEHKQLLEFINNFIDTRGKKNESEAIRFLMKKGLESLSSPALQTNIDMNKIKEELFEQIMASINKPQPIKIVEGPSLGYINPNGIAKIRVTEVVEESKPTNPLLANMLANRKRD